MNSHAACLISRIASCTAALVAVVDAATYTSVKPHQLTERRAARLAERLDRLQQEKKLFGFHRDQLDDLELRVQGVREDFLALAPPFGNIVDRERMAEPSLIYSQHSPNGGQQPYNEKQPPK